MINLHVVIYRKARVLNYVCRQPKAFASQRICADVTEISTKHCVLAKIDLFGFFFSIYILIILRWLSGICNTHEPVFMFK